MKHEVSGLEVDQLSPTFNKILEAASRANRLGLLTDDVMKNRTLFHQVIGNQLVEKS